MTELVSTAGAVVGSPQTVYTDSNYADSTAVGGSGAGSLVAFAKSDSILYGNRMNQSGQLLDGPSPTGGFTVSYELSTKSGGKIAFNGTDYLAVWVDDRDGANTGAIYATRLDAGGKVLDSPAFPVATQRPSMWGSVTVASNGTGWAVAWFEWNSTGSGSGFVRLVNADGSLVNGPASANGAPVSTNAWSVASLVSDGTDYLAVWQDARGSTTSTPVNNLYGLRFTQAAQVIPAMGSTDGSFAVATGNYEYGPSLGFDGTNYLLAWDNAAAFNSATASRLTTAGARVDGTVSTGGFTVNAANGSQVLAYDGNAYIAASSADVDIVVPPNGQVAQSQPNLNPVTSAVYDGASFWVFDDQGNGTRFRDDATVVDKTMVADSSNTSFLSSATDRLEDIIVIYPVGNDARGRLILDDAPNGASCGNGAYCASGVCEDGVCCDKACGGSTTDCQACTKAAGGTKDGFCTVAVMGYVCRPGDACELAGTCDGVTTMCPAPYYLPPTTMCGPSGACTAAQFCAGTSDTCNPGQPVADGTPCEDAGVCSSGVCNLPLVDAGPEGGGDSGGGVDAGAPEAGPDGAAMNDAGAMEGGGSSDAGSVADGGSFTDSGGKPAPDAGGTADASSDAPASQSDSGGGEPPGDSGSEANASAGGSGSSGGCGCRAAASDTSGEGGLVLLGALGMLGLARRRRRER